MTWDEKAQAVAECLTAQARMPKVTAEYVELILVEMALLQRKLLLSDESVERAARALNHEGWTDGWCEPDEYDQCERCRAACSHMARAALTAAIGGDDE